MATPLAGPRLTPALTETHQVRLDREAPLPALRAAAKDAHARALAAPADLLLRDVARILNALDISVVSGDRAAVDAMSGVLSKLTGRAWTASIASGDIRQLPARKGKGEDGPRRVRGLLDAAASALQWQSRGGLEGDVDLGARDIEARDSERGDIERGRLAASIGQLLAAHVAIGFPELPGSPTAHEAIALEAERLLRHVGQGGNRVERARGSAEELAAAALIANGMPRIEAHGRVKPGSRKGRAGQAP